MVSDQIIMKIDEFLGYPDKDPHGESFLVYDGDTYLALSEQLARSIKVIMTHD